jgi:hypothetical protein
MELLGDMGQVEDRFNSVEDGVNLGEIGAWFAPNVPLAWKSFWAYLMELRGNVSQMESKLISCVQINAISKRTEWSFYLTHIT